MLSSKKKRVLIILDEHTSHTKNIDAVEYACQRGNHAGKGITTYQIMISIWGGVRQDCIDVERISWLPEERNLAMH